MGTELHSKRYHRSSVEVVVSLFTLKNNGSSIVHGVINPGNRRCACPLYSIPAAKVMLSGGNCQTLQHNKVRMKVEIKQRKRKTKEKGKDTPNEHANKNSSTHEEVSC